MYVEMVEVSVPAAVTVAVSVRSGVSVRLEGRRWVLATSWQYTPRNNGVSIVSVSGCGLTIRGSCISFIWLEKGSIAKTAANNTEYFSCGPLRLFRFRQGRIGAYRTLNE